MNSICEFTGEYYFLSNFSHSAIKINGMKFNNAEAAFHSYKNKKRAKEFCSLAPNKAKQLGRQVKLRSDWETIKDDIMYQIVLAKFSQNEELKKKLLETGNAFLQERNTWGDTYWGYYKGKGKNKLGEILMLVRRELKNG